MSPKRILRLFVLALVISLLGRQLSTADPVKSIPETAKADDAERRDVEARDKLKDAGSDLELKDYDAAITKYTKFIDNIGLEGSCLD